MICFGVKTDLEVKEKGTCGSHFKIKKKTNIEKKKKGAERERERGSVRGKILFYFSLSLLSSIYGNRTVRIRRGKKQSALLDKGYAWEPKTRDFAEFSIKNSENPIFWFFSDLRLSNGQNWSEHETNFIHA